MEFLNYINTELTKSNSMQLNEKFDPFNGKSIGSVRSSDVMDLVQSIQGAKSALVEIEKISREKRAENLNIWADIIFLNAAMWSKKEAQFQGLPQIFVRNEIILPTVDLLRGVANSLMSQNATAFSPIGVVAISVSWGSSFLLAMERLASALASGNSVILHLTENSADTAEVLMELLKDSLWPKGSVQIIFGARNEIIPLLAGHPGIAALSYVGHEKHRANIQKLSAATGKRLQMSLSAKNSLIFLEEPSSPADLLEKLKPCLIGMGQHAWNAHRIFILESFRESFLGKLKLALESLQPAKDGNSPEISVWPVIDSRRIESLQKIRSQIPAEEGKVFWGGNALLGQGGFFVQPLFSIDLPNCSPWQQEDLRLPYFIITSVKYSHEIAKWNNTGSYGHSAIIWGPEDKARSLGQKLQVGQVFINKWKLSSAHDFVPQKLSREGNSDYRWSGSFFSESTVVI